LRKREIFLIIFSSFEEKNCDISSRLSVVNFWQNSVVSQSSDKRKSGFSRNTEAETFSCEPYVLQALETRLESAGQDSLESVLQSRLGRGPRVLCNFL
jgi:hypothetical protein